ncbi:MAG: TonB-dependent receptor [Betaproteobacteria bacterium HGW-Betaproteobacteria-11]|nr:MAG: TonB-dependent receptor [Betaproteobacteria bacterium HGW-Betaproteobacteria-11]
MNHPSRITAVAAAVVSIFSASLSAAAEPSTGNEAVVVIATRQPSRISALTTDITLLDRTTIEEAGPNATLGDLLTRVPGVELSRQGSRGAPEGIFIRGANTGHTLVLVDGLRVGSATLGATAIESLPLTQIERIEILRGAASALYGSDAIGGVIRITTRPATESPRLDVSLGAGSRGAQEASLAHSGHFGQLDYGLRVSDSRNRGVSMITNPSSSAYNPDKDGSWRRTTALHATWRPNEKTEIGAQWFETDGMNRFDADGFPPFGPPASSDWQTRHKITSYSAHAKTKLTDDWSSTFRAGRSEDDSVSTPSFTLGQANDRFKTRQDQFVWQNDIHLPLGQALVAVETLREKIASTNIYTGTQRTTDSLVLGWNGSAGAHFWQLAVRHDDNSQFGGKTTETLGYGYRLTPLWRVAANTGTSFKAPTFNDLYFPNTPFVGVGNPALQPETGRSNELALHYEEGDSQASLTAFRNTIHNLIQWEESPPGSFFYTPRNVGQARITGWTAAASTRLAGWTVGGHLTVQNPKDMDTGEYLIRRAKKFATLSLGHDSGRWSWGGEIQGSGPRYDAPDFFTRKNTKKMGGYGVVNLHGEYQLDHGWSVFARVDNLFDKQYQLVTSSSTDYAALGTTVFVGARFTLK